jgi:hypothetical protein
VRITGARQLNPAAETSGAGGGGRLSSVVAMRSPRLMILQRIIDERAAALGKGARSRSKAAIEL